MLAGQVQVTGGKRPAPISVVAEPASVVGTGTRTERRWAVRHAVTPGGVRFGVTGLGYAPYGGVQRDGTLVAVPDELRRLARAGLLCNDAAVAPPDAARPDWTAVGDPLEAALVTFAARCGLDPVRTRTAWPRIAAHPFDQRLRRMTTVHRCCDRRYLVVCKGAPEGVLRMPLLDATDGEVAALTAVAQRSAGIGLRVLALAAALVGTAPVDTAHPVGLRPLGLVAVGDLAESAGRSGAPAGRNRGPQTVTGPGGSGR
ncbi:cation-transporting P-type ATPase [Micromonospora craniellae]|uniref:Cation-transporting P-type ATPase n=1 Tax=Micromonospora craniellae TaxID=2294034 RepID=A0A372FUN8_9ACTN|nr:cation-transporting P-type ATPase [Micromonospora craniellae]QOC92539.1 cation-transporting P-type ATPase [Micromonospora craniellae]RFS44240.1 cation-transporting P-type ATPase [Micromonospora craniellae]